MTKHCLWGWRRGWIQIGSDYDRKRECVADTVVQVQRQIGDALTPTLQRTVDAMQAIISDIPAR